MYTFDFSRFVSWWAMALCVAILRHLRDLLLYRRVSVAKYLLP